MRRLILMSGDTANLETDMTFTTDSPLKPLLDLSAREARRQYSVANGDPLSYVLTTVGEQFNADVENDYKPGREQPDLVN